MLLLSGDMLLLSSCVTARRCFLTGNSGPNVLVGVGSSADLTDCTASSNSNHSDVF